MSEDSQVLAKQRIPPSDVTPAPAEWEHFPHGADIGVRGRGASLAEAFEQAAVALSAAVTDAEIRASAPAAVRCDAPDIELLLVEWLNTIIFEMATRGMLFGAFEARIDGSQLEGTLWGEPGRRRAPFPGLRAKGGDLHGA